MKVIKRNGEVVPYDFSKIEKAVTSAFKAVTKEDPTSEFYDFLDDLQLIIKKRFSETDTLEVEIIQDIIEHELMGFEYFEVAKAYILYRAEHSKIRNGYSELLTKIYDRLHATNVENANANVD